MVQAAALLLGATFLLLVIANVRAFLQRLSETSMRSRFVMLAALMMFFGSALWIKRDGVLTDSTLDLAAMIQLGAMLGAAAVLSCVFATTQVATVSFRNLRFGGVWLAAYALVAILSAAVSPSPFLSVYKGALLLIDAFLILVAVANMQRREAELLLSLVFLCFGLLTAMLAVSAAVFPSAGLVRIGGILGVQLWGVYPAMNPNGIGFVAAVSVIGAAIKMVQDRVPIRLKVLFAGQFVLGIGVLFLAQARTSTVALGLGLMFVTWSIRKLKWAFYVLLAGTLMYASYVAITGSGSGAQDIAIAYLKRGQSLQQQGTLSGRTTLWARGWEMILESPVIGHGYEAGTKLKQREYGLEAEHLHNSHLQVLANTGVLGYIGWAGLIVALGGHLFGRVYRLYPVRTDEGYLVVGLGAVFLMILVRSLTGSVLVVHQFTSVLIAATIVYAAVYARPQRTAQSPESPQPQYLLLMPHNTSRPAETQS